MIKTILLGIIIVSFVGYIIYVWIDTGQFGDRRDVFLGFTAICLFVVVFILLIIGVEWIF